MSNSMSAEADVLQCGFDVGYFDKSDIARWADRWIIALAEPCDELFDLSMNRRFAPIDIVILLRNLGSSEPSSPVQTEIGFVGLLYGDKRISAQYAIGLLFLLVYKSGITTEEASRIYYLDDACDLAYSGVHGSIAQIELELANFVSPYIKQLAAQYPELIPPRK